MTRRGPSGPALSARRAPSTALPTRLLPYLLIAAIYGACALLVDPRGEFPLNDAWSYTRSAFGFGAVNRLQVDEWSAPSLVGQALYGGLLVKVFGPAFLPLRLSTLALSCATACLLWASFSRLPAPRYLAWIATLSWIFNPIQFCLAFSFMTEIPFLFFVTLAMYLLLRHPSQGRLSLLAAAGASLGYAFLIRQTALLFVVPTMAVLASAPAEAPAGKAHVFRANVWRKAGKIAAFAAPAGLFVAGYYIWGLQGGGSSPAAQRKFELLGRLTTQQLTGNGFGMLFYLAFFLLPVLTCLIPRLWNLSRNRGKLLSAGAAAGWVLLSCSGLWWFHACCSAAPYLPSRAYHGRMPFLLNILYDTGLGPVTLDPTYYGPPATPVHPAAWLAVTWAVAAAAVILGTLLTFILARIGALAADWRPAAGSGGTAAQAALHPLLWCATLSFLCVVLFEIIFSHLQEGGLFDRHILTALLPLYFILVLGAAPESRGTGTGNGAPGPQPRSGKASRMGSIACAALALAMLSVLAGFCITATHDYLAWNRLRWELGTNLLARNVDPLTVSGGFEFNAWHNYDTFRARGGVEKVYHWWYDHPDYLITLEPQEGYRTLERKHYFSWLHRRLLPVYLLKKL